MTANATALRARRKEPCLPAMASGTEPPVRSPTPKYRIPKNTVHLGASFE
jgi:hypothetical protein